MIFFFGFFPDVIAAKKICAGDQDILTLCHILWQERRSRGSEKKTDIIVVAMCKFPFHPLGPPFGGGKNHAHGRSGNLRINWLLVGLPNYGKANFKFFPYFYEIYYLF